MVTIKDVAALSGLSTGTVSRVINGSGYVSTESRKKIEHAMAELNYHPNAMARALNHKQSKIIGLVIPDITNPFFPMLTRGVEDTASKYGYTVMLCNIDENSEAEKRYIDMFKRYYVEGIISAALLTVAEWDSIQVPIVMTDQSADLNYPTVAVDNVKAAKEMTEFLISKGATQIVHIAGSAGVNTALDRREGYKQAMEEAGLSSNIFESDFNSNEIKDKAGHFFDTYEHPDALFCANDLIAAIFMKEAMKRDIKIPEEMQIVGFDGILMSEMLSPPLTTMRQPIYEMGQIACETLIKKVESNTEVGDTILKATLQIGGTTL